MAINLVIKVDEDFNPEHDNIIIYNSEKGVWELVTKDFFFKEVKKEFQKQFEENKAVAEKIEKLNNKISKLAEILKGELS
jgi:HD superfamily phosphodiesterase